MADDLKIPGPGKEHFIANSAEDWNGEDHGKRGGKDFERDDSRPQRVIGGTENAYPYRENNFDLIRFLAAFQVLLGHANSELGLNWPSGPIEYFPGVPIFFFTSGFLISASYERIGNIRRYAENRLLRIFPALFVCVLLTVLSVWAVGYRFEMDLRFFAWLIAQTTFLQFYNLDAFRGFGTGVLNGSLWTISVEVSFYILLPVIYKMTAKRYSFDWGVAALIGISVLIDWYVASKYPLYHDVIYFKLVYYSILPYLWMFLIGVLAQRHYARLVTISRDKGFWLLFIYVAIAWVGTSRLGVQVGNHPSFVLFLLLSLLVLSFSTALNGRPARLLAGRDISYGLYIYHMPVVNILIVLGFAGTTGSLAFVALCTTGLAWISWELIEAPALRFKQKTIHRLA